MTGFADSAWASAPFGTGTPDSAVVPPDPPSGARYLDPSVRDWVVGDDYEWQRMPAVRQAVLVALMTVAGSSTVERGRGVLLPRKVGASYADSAKIAITNALRFLIDGGKLRLLGVDIDVQRPGRVRHTVRYFDLTLDQEDSVIV